MVMVAATVNQEATPPTTGGAEYDLWLEYINRALEEWGQSHDWDALRKFYYPTITGGATVSLPDDFRKLGGPVKMYSSASEVPKEFPLVLPERTGGMNPSEQFITITGDSSVGQSLLFHPGTLASGASLEVLYFCTPTSLASPSQITQVPDAQYLIDRTIAYIFESRSDPRFQIMEAKAKDKLLMMIENANAATYTSYSNQAPVQTTLQKLRFRMGRD